MRPEQDIKRLMDIMNILKEILIVTLCFILGGGIPYIVVNTLIPNPEFPAIIFFYIMTITHGITVGRLIGKTFH